jgi:hypothetical protein
MLSALVLACSLAVPAAAQHPDLASYGVDDRDEELPYEGSIVPGYHIEERPRAAWLWVGGLTLAGAYAVSAGMGVATLTDGEEGAWRLFLPFVGPFLYLASDPPRDSSGSPAEAAASDVGRVFGPILLGLGQLAGAVVFLVGLATRKVLVIGDEEVAFAPALEVGEDGATAGLAGSF